MKVSQAVLNTDSLQKTSTASDTASRERKETQTDMAASSTTADKSKLPQDEVLSKVKALLDGTYSVRFERDESTSKVVIRLIDSKTGEAIRQIPPEEFLQLAQILEKNKGQLLHATS